MIDIYDQRHLSHLRTLAQFPPPPPKSEVWGQSPIAGSRSRARWVWGKTRRTNNNNNRFMVLCLGLPGWAGTRRNIHPPTILIIIPSLSASSMYYNTQHPPCSNCVLGNLFAQPLSMFYLVYLLVWSPPPPYTSLPNQCLLFITYAYTITTCFAVVSTLYHMFLVFLSTPYLELYLLP